MSKNSVRPRKTCAKCKRTILADANFYKCDKSFIFPDKYFNLCRRCTGDTVSESDDGYGAMLSILHAMNKPFLSDVWNSSEHVGDYMRQINSLPQYRAMDWSHGDVGTGESSSGQPKATIDTASDKVVERYGAGYTDEEYEAFERKYKNLTRNYTEQTAMHSEGLISYIRFRVKEEMATAKNDFKESKEWAAMAEKAARDAKLNVAQLSKSDISGGVDLMSQLSEAVETKASVIPLLPKMLEQPYDDADMILWANIDYYRMLEGKPRADYRDIWGFYDEMLEEQFKQEGLSDDEIEEEKRKRNNVFRDLADVYIEPLYEDDD